MMTYNDIQKFEWYTDGGQNGRPLPRGARVYDITGVHYNLSNEYKKHLRPTPCRVACLRTSLASTGLLIMDVNRI